MSTVDVLTATVKAAAGPDAEPRIDQSRAVQALVDDRSRVLLVQSTGWGKSVVYWGATAAIRSDGGGPALVISPLLALMRDQIAAAERTGLRAATVNSTNIDAWDEVFSDLADDRLDVLLVSPERLANPRFAQRLPDLLSRCGLLVIDEAHCVSDWGFDFRPDYQRLTRSLLSLSPGTPVLATTATANQRVTTDVAQQLAADGAETVTFRGSLARSSLRLVVVPELAPLERYAWLAEALNALPGSGIVYVLTVAEAERVAGFLHERGLDVAAYTAQTENRTELEDQLLGNRIKALVATSALGMGYDKPDLAFCIHLGSPASPVAYYQQVGRAGRALDDAVAVLVPSKTDERIWEYFATAGIPDPKQVDQVLEVIDEQPVSESAISTITGIRPGRLATLLKIIAVDDAVQKVSGGWQATGKGWEYDQQKWSELRRIRVCEADLMRRYARGEDCLMEFLQLALDDPHPSPCGRCSVCTGQLPEPGRRPHPETVQAARKFFRGLDTIVEPRKQWPSRVDGVRGKINFLSEGRAIAFADDPAWQDVLEQLWHHDAAAPQEVLDAAVEVLKRWSRSWNRPTAVVGMPSRRFPTLIGSVAHHLATVGRLPLIDALVVNGRRPSDDAASGVRVRELLDGLQIAPGTQLSGPVLLVDDTIQSRWTVTVAGKLLSEAGAAEVLPFAVHQLP